jgi:hypothetical protein
MRTDDAARSRRTRALTKAGAIAVGALGVWIVLALANRGTTYHLAPLIVAAAAPVAARLELEARLPVRDLLVLTTVGVGAALVGVVVLWPFGALDGPAVVGGSAPAETALAIALGAVAGLVTGRVPGKAAERVDRRESADDPAARAKEGS